MLYGEKESKYVKAEKIKKTKASVAMLSAL